MPKISVLFLSNSTGTIIIFWRLNFNPETPNFSWKRTIGFYEIKRNKNDNIDINYLQGGS